MGMTGKVFAESRNVYQDQAALAFDYFHDAAEKIVAAEVALEKQIKAKEQVKMYGSEALAKQQKNKTTMLVLMILSFVLLVVGLLFGFFAIAIPLPIVFLSLFIKAMNDCKNTARQIAGVDEALANLHQQHKDIFRNYRIEKLGVAYVPVAERLPYGEQSFVVDYTDHEANTAFDLRKVNNEKLLNEKVDELDRMVSSAPIVESSDNVTEVDSENYSRSIQKVKYFDYFTGIDRNLRLLSQCLNDVTTQSVSLPVVKPDSEMDAFLREYATSEVGNAPVINVFDVHQFDAEIRNFNELTNTRMALAVNSRQFEQTLRNLIKKMAASVQVVSKLKVASANKMVEESNKLLFKMLKASYNHYSPELEADEIAKMREEDFNYSEAVERYTPFMLKPSSRVRYNITSDCWVAEDGSKTTAPFSISQLQEEIVAPIVQNLLMESRLERLRIYNNIKDQKINYLNQWHQDTENFYGRNRTTSDDLKNLMRANLTKFLAAQTTLTSLESMKKSMADRAIESKKTDEKDNSAEMLAAYELQAQDFEKVQNDFEDYMTRLKDDIDDRAQQFGYIEYYDGSLRDNVAKQIVTAADNADNLDERRKPLLAVNPLYAEISEMPPIPDVEAVTDEHMSMNLNVLAERALRELDEQEAKFEEEEARREAEQNIPDADEEGNEEELDEEKIEGNEVEDDEEESDEADEDADEAPDPDADENKSNQ